MASLPRISACPTVFGLGKTLLPVCPRPVSSSRAGLPNHGHFQATRPTVKPRPRELPVARAAGVLEDSNEYSSDRATAAVAAEFIGTFLFAAIGAAAPAGLGAVTNACALAVLVFATANVSGGHLNPAVSITLWLTGYVKFSKAAAYISAQIAGATLAAVMHSWIIPGASSVGNFAPAMGVTYLQAFAWEAILAFILVSVIFATAVSKPNFGIVAPLAIGLSLFAGALTGGVYTGAAVNPARVLGPAFVFPQDWTAVPVYIGAEILGAVLAGILAMVLYGGGPHLKRRD